MIRYTVLWRRDVENELMTLWIDSTSRQAITDSADSIDSELNVDAHLKGTEFPNGIRVLVVAPLAAYFRIDEADRKVFVEAIQLNNVN